MSKYIEIDNEIITLENIKHIYWGYCCGDIMYIKYLDGTEVRFKIAKNSSKHNELKKILITQYEFSKEENNE